MASPARCHLLELPKELRIEICEYLVRPWELQIYSNSPHTCTRHTCTHKKSAWSDPPTITIYFAPKQNTLHPSLLRVCRIIHDDAAPLLLQPIELTFQHSFDDETDRPHGKYDLRPVHVSVLRKIKNVQAVNLSLATWADGAAGMMLNSENLAHCLRLGLVQCVTLNLADWPCLDEVDEDDGHGEVENGSQEDVDLSNLVQNVALNPPNSLVGDEDEIEGEYAEADWYEDDQYNEDDGYDEGDEYDEDDGHDEDIETGKETPGLDALLAIANHWGQALPCKEVRFVLWTTFMFIGGEHRVQRHEMGHWNRDAGLTWTGDYHFAPDTGIAVFGPKTFWCKHGSGQALVCTFC